MTSWVNKMGLILGLAFFTFACEEPSEIGINLNPENGAFVAKYQELFLPSHVVQHEDVLSDNSTRINREPRRPNSFQAKISDGRLLTGSYYTPDFGKLSATGFSSLYLSLTGFQPADSAFVFDSLVMNIKVDYLYGTNYNGTKKIRIHELSEEIELDSVYLTKNSTAYVEDPVGEFNIDVSKFDSTRVDTVFRTRLSDALGQKLFDRAVTDTLTYYSDAEFRKFFNGFAFVSDEANDLVMGIHAESNTTFVRMYIHNANKNTFFDYELEGYDADGDDITRYYNQITLDKSGTPLQAVNSFYTPFQLDKSYSQSSTGVFTELDLKPYVDFLDTIGRLVVNKAEIIIPVEPFDDNLLPLSQLDIYMANDQHKFIEVYDANKDKILYGVAGQLTFVKDKDVNSGHYIGDMTQYFQQIANGNIEDYQVLLGQPSLYNSVINVHQTVFNKDQIYLNIYYSELQ